MTKTFGADRIDAPTPLGAIKFRREIIDLISESREEGTEIRIWTVTQGGALSAFIITPMSRLDPPKVPVYDPAVLCSGPDFYAVRNVYFEYGFDSPAPTRYMSVDGALLGSFNIEGNYATSCHYAFTNEMMARRYSEELKNDSRYIESVAQWHAECDMMDDFMDSYYDNMGYDDAE